jgi:hypothetical protein
MVSRIRFRSFKDLTLSRRTVFGFLAIGAFTTVVLLARMHSAFVFVSLMAAYLALGLFEEIIFFRTRRAEERAKKEPTTVLEAEGGAKSDEEVLEELGAFDEARADEHAVTPGAPASDKRG